MASKILTLIATRRAIRRIRSASLRRDFTSLAAGAESAIRAREKRMVPMHLAALATMAHGLKQTLSARVAYGLLKGIFDDAIRFQIGVKIAMHQRFRDHYCPISGPSAGFCQPKKGYICYDNGLGSCISGKA